MALATVSASDQALEFGESFCLSDDKMSMCTLVHVCRPTWVQIRRQQIDFHNNTTIDNPDAKKQRAARSDTETETIMQSLGCGSAVSSLQFSAIPPLISSRSIGLLVALLVTRRQCDTVRGAAQEIGRRQDPVDLVSGRDT